MKLITILLCIIFSGCMEYSEILSSKNSSGIIRHTLFFQCMKLAARIPRQGEGNVANIIEECNSNAYYTSNHIGRAGETQEFLLNQGD